MRSSAESWIENVIDSHSGDELSAVKTRRCIRRRVGVSAAGAVLWKVQASMSMRRLEGEVGIVIASLSASAVSTDGDDPFDERKSTAMTRGLLPLFTNSLVPGRPPWK